MPDFRVVAPYEPTGDQPKAIDALVAGLNEGQHYQTLLGATATGKTFVMAHVIARYGRPALVLAHNKTLAAQLYSEFRELLPDNAVEYFVSYYDYYQPEAYVPRHDLYIEKDADVNEEIDKLRHAATKALLSRRDVVIVASVSCIYGLGSPAEYAEVTVALRRGEQVKRDRLLRHLVDIQYQRNDSDFRRGTFRVRGDTLEIYPAYEDLAVRVELWGDEIERIVEVDPLTGEVLAERTATHIYPAKHFVTTAERLQGALAAIREELMTRLNDLEREGKLVEAQRLRQRTNYDLEMMEQQGFCAGIENYSRHLAGRAAGDQPSTLLDYFPDDWILFVDESHMTLPQVRGMYGGDRKRKGTLVEYGFRLPSAIDNRPLRFDEFEQMINQAVFVSATPGPYEYEHSARVVEQIIRPTGVVDPVISVRPTTGQVDDLLEEVRLRVTRGERALVTTLTKRMAEDLADYLKEMGVRTHHLHSEIDTLERVEILRDLRLGIYDVVVGINLLREGLDLPEVSLVAILDADKEGFLRSRDSLIQIIGRAARHLDGAVVMYADRLTDSMRQAIEETERRRNLQLAHNEAHGIVPVGIHKEVRDLTDRVRAVAEQPAEYSVGGVLATMPRDELTRLIKDLESQMKQASKMLEFERAAQLRDQIVELRRALEG